MLSLTSLILVKGGYKYMGKKSIRFLETSSKRTQINYASTIKEYEAFHGTTIDELVDEALNEQVERVPHHQLKVIDRIESYQDYLIKQNLVHGTIGVKVGRIKTIYRKNRVELPYLTPLNPKQTRRREYIEYSDVLTKEELKCALSHMRLPAKAQAMVMIQGGLSLEECEHLSYRAFIDELYKYHQCDDDMDALRWLSDERNPVIWVTKLIRIKTGKPYYAIIGAEAVNTIAQAKLYQWKLPSYQHTDKLLTITKQGFSRTCRVVNKKCGFGLVAEESKFRSHNLRRFNATYIKGSALTYEENSLSNSQIDEMQGRGKTSVQDTYIKTNPLTQKLLYAKVMNNVSLYHEYNYVLTDDDVKIFLVDQLQEKKKLEEKVRKLESELDAKKRASEKVEKLKNELGEDVFNEVIAGILNVS